MQMDIVWLSMQDVDQGEFAETWEASSKDFIYHPDKGVWGRKAGATNSEPTQLHSGASAFGTPSLSHAHVQGAPAALHLPWVLKCVISSCGSAPRRA